MSACPVLGARWLPSTTITGSCLTLWLCLEDQAAGETFRIPADRVIHEVAWVCSAVRAVSVGHDQPLSDMGRLGQHGRKHAAQPKGAKDHPPPGGGNLASLL